MPPEAFWRTLPSHFEVMCRGALGRVEEERLFQATMTAHLVNSNGFVKHPVTAEQLLGIEHKGVKPFSRMNGREQRSALEEAWQSTQRQRQEAETSSCRRLQN